jgi:MFS family permease
LLIAGLGSGLVISPNQTVTLSEVPVHEAGTAGGLLQTGQRIGAAIGIAVVGSVFFSRLAATGGRDWSKPFETGLMISAAFVMLALLIAIIDIVVDRRTVTSSADD